MKSSLSLPKRQQERLNREAFRELLNEHEAKKTLTYKTKWKNFLQLIKDDERFLNLVKLHLSIILVVWLIQLTKLGQYGSTPRELFEDKMEILKENHKKLKDDIKLLLKVKIETDNTIQLCFLFFVFVWNSTRVWKCQPKPRKRSL